MRRSDLREMTPVLFIQAVYCWTYGGSSFDNCTRPLKVGSSFVRMNARVVFSNFQPLIELCHGPKWAIKK